MRKVYFIWESCIVITLRLQIHCFSCSNHKAEICWFLCFWPEPLNSLKSGLCLCIRRTTSCLKDFLPMFYSIEFYNFWNMHSIRKPEHVGILNRKWRLSTGNPVSYSMTLNIISEIGQPHSLLSFHSLMTNDVNLLICLYIFLIYFVCVWSIYSNLFSFFFHLGCVLMIGSFM